MYRDSLGNTYKSLPPRKPNPGAKPSKGGASKYNRNRDTGQTARTTANIARRRRIHFALHPNDRTAPLT